MVQLGHALMNDQEMLPTFEYIGEMALTSVFILYRNVLEEEH